MSLANAAAENLPFADASFDTIVSTLVLCSVDDPAQCAAELRRVLKPDGVLLFVEHIQSDRGRLSEFAQNVAVPIWRQFVGGCHLNRPTLATLRQAGFCITELDRFEPPNVPSVMFPFVVCRAVLSEP